MATVATATVADTFIALAKRHEVATLPAQEAGTLAQVDDYYRGKEAEYELNHMQWEVNRIADRRNFRHLERSLRRAACKPHRILDIACGTGRTLQQLEGSGRQLVGIDLSHGLMHLARTDKKVPASYAVSEASRLPFPDDAFDLVTINGALHHIDADYATVAEAGRVLRPGGVLAILGEPSSRYMRWRNPFFLLGMMFARIVSPKLYAEVIEARRAKGIEDVNFEEGAHNINPQRLLKTCQTANLRKLSFHSYDYFPRFYSHSRAAVRAYTWMLRFEETVFHRVLPLNGTVLRYFGVKSVR